MSALLLLWLLPLAGAIVIWAFGPQLGRGAGWLGSAVVFASFACAVLLFPSASNVTGVTFTCSTNFSVGGSVTGLGSGASVVLQDNGGGNLTVSANGSFSFATTLATGAKYSVTILTQPSGEVCGVTNGAGE